MKKIKVTAIKIVCKVFILLILFFTSCFVVSCTTSINVKVEHPPALNTSGIKRIAIMPFESAFANREMAQYTTSAVTARIQEMNYFTLVASSEIERLRNNNQSIEDYVDATFTGRIIRIDTKREASQGSYKAKGGKTVNYTDYTTNVEIEFNYSLVIAQDGRLIGPVTKKNTNSATSRDNYPSAPELIRAAIDSQLRLLGRDIAPYTTYESRTFSSETSSDKTLKAEMKNALEMVKAGNYKIALDMYLRIYEQYKNAAAAENAAILHELLNGTDTAADFMRQVYNDTGNPKALDVLSRLNRIQRDKAIIANDYSDNRNRTDRVTAFASEEIHKILPKGAKVWIYNNAADNPITAAVVDNITSDLIKNGISVVDRQNAKLIDAEREYQMSGYVSDDDFISIGNAAGANTIVVIGITGSGAERRLQVRVLNVERGVSIMQSDTGEKWRI